MSLTEKANQLKKLIGNPDQNITEITSIGNELLEMKVKDEEINSSHIKLYIKNLIKKTKNSDVKEKYEAVLSHLEGMKKQPPPQQTPVRTQSTEFKEVRGRVKSQFIKLLSKETTDDNKVEEIAALIEDQVNQDFVEENKYLTQVNLLVNAIANKDSYFHFVQKLLSGALPPAEFARYTLEDIQTDKERKKMEELEKEALNKTCTPQPKKVASRIFQCPKCKSWETFFNQLQTRGGDEPMTNFCECLNCGYTFKR